MEQTSQSLKDQRERLRSRSPTPWRRQALAVVAALVLASGAERALFADSPLSVNVLVLNFDPLVPTESNQRLHAALGFCDPHQLASELMQSITTASVGYVNYQLAEWRDVDAVPVKIDGYSYSSDDYVDRWRNGGPWHDPDVADYPALLNAYVSPQAVDAREIDEVWLFGAPYFGFFESAMAGPGAFYINGGVYPEFPTNRPFAIMGFNYERQLDAMLHSLGHRAESSLERFFGEWNIAHPETLWDQFTSNVGQTASGPYGIGSVHYPTNAISDYEYSSPLEVSSTAVDWLNYPDFTGAVQDVSAADWGATELGYMEYWYRHLPHVDGIHDGVNKVNNWWKYIYEFEQFDLDGLPAATPRRGPNGHYYRFVEAPGVTWQQALDAAAQESFGGYPGHLATVASADEEAYLVELIRGREIWLAGSDAGQEGTWRWMAGPETGEVFFAEGAPVGYSGFAFGQPDGDASENHLHMIFGEYWNDVHDAYPNNLGYVVEFSVLPGDYDHDADVDGLDFLTWQRTFGSDWDLEADGNGNSVVDGNDIAVWQSRLGQSPAAGAEALAEPASTMIVLGLALGCIGDAPTRALTRHAAVRQERNRSTNRTLTPVQA